MSSGSCDSKSDETLDVTSDRTTFLNTLTDPSPPPPRPRTRLPHQPADVPSPPSDRPPLGHVRLRGDSVSMATGAPVYRLPGWISQGGHGGASAENGLTMELGAAQMKWKKDNPSTCCLGAADASLNQENKQQQVLQHIWDLNTLCGATGGRTRGTK